MPLLGFTVFKDKILDGSKNQTIRKLRKYPIKIDDKLYLYWHTRQKDCEKLGERICSDVFVIQIHSEYWGGKQRPLVLRYCGLGKANNLSSWDRLTGEEVLDLAKRDGFQGLDDFLEWFISHNGTGETYQVIRWSSLSEKGTT
jgi:hypothetical protein